MPLNVRSVGDVVILSNFARLMNDPRYVDAARDLDELLDRGARRFVIDLTGVRETGASFLGLLMTLTRRIRQERGEAVVANPSREMKTFLLDDMQMEEYWDILPSVEEAVEFQSRAEDRADDDDSTLSDPTNQG
ncbi:MAG: STAS domain-containing protein [Isosphaeraceae bacterium]